jgi:hypothetical protein
MVLCTVPRAKRMETKDKHGNVTYCYKHGLHVYAPNLFVSAQQALDIREQLVVQCELEFGPRPDHNDWSKVIDYSVYTSAGLRLPYSGKTDDCPACKDKSKKDKGGVCPNHCKNGRLCERWRRYEPAVALLPSGDFDALESDKLKDPLYALRRTCIRYHAAPNEHYVLPRGCERSCLLGRVPKRSRAGGDWHDSDDETPDDMHEDARKRLQSVRNAVLCSKREQWYPELLDAIHKLDKYEGVIFRQVLFVGTEKPYYLVHPRGPGAQYCTNKLDYHNGNTAYFFVSPNGIIQKCFCRCPTKRATGIPCKDYKGNRRPLKESLREKMFPDSIKGAKGYLPEPKKQTGPLPPPKAPQRSLIGAPAHLLNRQ